MAIVFDYEKEKLRVKAELESGRFDIEVMENEGVDYSFDIDDDVSAFERHLDSEESKSLAAEVLGQ